MALADEIVSAAKMNSNALGSLTRNSNVSAYEQAYWAAMSNGTGESFGGIYNGLGVSSCSPWMGWSRSLSHFSGNAHGALAICVAL